MAGRSRPLSLALRLRRPVVVDFSAVWCPDCLKEAPTLRDLERQYGRDVEFVTVDVSTLPSGDAESLWWARQFRVDAIPHVAFVGAGGEVLTALVGNLPAEVLRADVEALRDGGELPYVMYDAFQGGRKLQAPAPFASGAG